MVLARGKRKYVLAVNHDDKAGFFAFEEFLNDNACACRAELVAREHVVNGVVRFIFGHGDYNAFAGGQTVSLDDNRSAFGAYVFVSGLWIAKAFVFGRRNTFALHEGLGEIFGTFELSGFLGRAENQETRGAENVDHTFGKGGFRTNDREVNLVFQGPVAQGFDVGDGEVFQAAVSGRSGVAGGNPNFFNTFGFGKTPGKRVFTTAAADH